MKRLQSRKDLNGYTMMRQVLINLDLTNNGLVWKYIRGRIVRSYALKNEKSRGVRNDL